MNIKEIYLKGKNILKENSIDDFDIKAKILICWCLNIKKEELILKLDEDVSDNIKNQFFENIDKIKQGIPIQYITHSQEFMGLNFFVNENVLIPQADTEILVEETIKIASQINLKECRILDLCTGSGAIAVSLNNYIKDVKPIVYASDISNLALEVARKNAENNNAKVVFLESDLFEKITENNFDIIVSNPPYIENSVIDLLNTEVKHEPYIALAGGVDGLDFYRKIAKDARGYLKDGGWLCLEIGYNQKEWVTKILNESGYREIKCIKDLGDNDRVIVCRK